MASGLRMMILLSEQNTVYRRILYDDAVTRINPDSSFRSFGRQSQKYASVVKNPYRKLSIGILLTNDPPIVDSVLLKDS